MDKSIIFHLNHEIRNSLMGIKSCIYMLRDKRYQHYIVTNNIERYCKRIESALNLLKEDNNEY